METLGQYHAIMGISIARVFLGVLFFFQGYDAIFNVKLKNVIETYQATFNNNGSPRYLTVCASWFTSYTELIGGILLVFGLFEYATLYILGINLLIAAVGFGIVTPLWDSRFVFPRLVLLLLLLLSPSGWHIFSLDQLFLKL